jgi:MFS family permease
VFFKDWPWAASTVVLRSTWASTFPTPKRGFYTSFIQITATLGLFISLIVILVTQSSISKEDFAAYGWRIPFLISIVLVAISLYIRLKMKESPIFAQLKSNGMSSTQPLKDAFTHWANLKNVLISLFGPPPARAWFGMQDSSTHCFTCRRF